MEHQAGELTSRRCKPCEAGMMPLAADEVSAYLAALSGWERAGDEIVRTFSFKNYYQTVSFVNAVAWVAQKEDHHPDITFGYKLCTVRYSTHAIGGLSENDFICAAKVDALLG